MTDELYPRKRVLVGWIWIWPFPKLVKAVAFSTTCLWLLVIVPCAGTVNTVGAVDIMSNVVLAAIRSLPDCRTVKGNVVDVVWVVPRLMIVHCDCCTATPTSTER